MIVNLTYWCDDEVVGSFRWVVDAAASLFQIMCKLEESVYNLPDFLGKDVTCVSIFIERELVKNETENLFD